MTIIEFLQSNGWYQEPNSENWVRDGWPEHIKYTFFDVCEAERTLHL